MDTSAISALTSSALAHRAADLTQAPTPVRKMAGPFNPAALRNAGPEEQRRGVAAQFEAILVRQMLGKTMTSMLGGSTGGVSGSIYGDMLADTLAQQLTAGQGLGLGRYLEQQLAPRGNSADAAAAHPATDATSTTQANS